MMTVSSAAGVAGCVAWAVAGRPIDGEFHSGDLHVVEAHQDRVLLGLIDGLGHGIDAAAAAQRARAVLCSDILTEPLHRLFQRCHDELWPTRGVVMSLALVDGESRSITWGGIGNVEGYLLRVRTARRELITLRSGVVGGQLPPVYTDTVHLDPGDMVVLASDGIAARFVEVLAPAEPQEMADRVIAQYGKAHDDALVLVAKYNGTTR